MGRLDVHIRHGDGGGETLAVVALAIGVAAFLIHQAWHTIIAIWHVILTILTIAAWTLAGVTGAAALTGGVLAGLRIRRAVRAHRTAGTARPPVVTITPAGHIRPVPLHAERPAAIEPPRPASSWPLPGWWAEVRPRIGGDSDEHRPR